MKKLVALASIAVAITACSNVSESWKNYSSDSLTKVNLSDNQSLAVFYRTEDTQTPPINVYVNGDYQVSLLEKGFSPITLCSKNQLVTASYSQNGFGNRTEGVHFDLPAKEIAFFRANVSSGKPVFERVEETIAREELNTLNGKVVHALSRVTSNQNCN